jgi:hypothetical protein
MPFFIEMEKNAEVHMELQKAEYAITKKNKGGIIIFPNFKLYYKTIIIKIVWHWHNNRPHETK